MQLLALDFPGIDHIVTFEPIALLNGPTSSRFNKVALIAVMATLVTIAIFFLAAAKALVPTGIQNVAELAVETIEREIVIQTMGPDGLKFMPYLTSLFFFVFFCNITEIIPFMQMPASARMAIPGVLALITWLVFNAVGVIKQGPGGYLKNTLFPPGVPGPCYISVTPHRVHLGLHRAALLPGRPTLRQHARRPHPAGHLRRAVNRARAGTDPLAGRHPLRRHVRRHDRLRGLGVGPAGVHLHDPHRCLHRRFDAPRTLIGADQVTQLNLVSTPRAKRVIRRLQSNVYSRSSRSRTRRSHQLW